MCVAIQIEVMVKQECCKQCRYVKFKGTMTKWPVQKQTHKTAQNTQNTQNTKTQQTFSENKNMFCVFRIFIFYFFLFTIS